MKRITSLIAITAAAVTSLMASARRLPRKPQFPTKMQHPRCLSLISKRLVQT